MHLEFSEKQQAFHLNYGNVQENTHTYKTLFSGTLEEIDALEYLVNKAKDIRDSGYLTFERKE